jgi:hypothetical protein
LVIKKCQVQVYGCDISKLETEITGRNTHYHTYKTLYVADIFKYIQQWGIRMTDDETLLQNKIPYVSNYQYDSHTDRVVYIDDEFDFSSTKLIKHVHLNELTNECRIGLTKRQCTIFENIIKKVNKHKQHVHYIVDKHLDKNELS